MNTSSLFVWLLVALSQMGRHKGGYIFVVGIEIADERGRDMGIFWARIKDDCLDAAYLFVRLRHVAFVLEIRYAADTAQDKLRIHLLREINGQAVVNHHADTRLVSVEFLYRRLALADGEGLFLGAVSAYADDYLVKQLQPTQHDVVVP